MSAPAAVATMFRISALRAGEVPASVRGRLLSFRAYDAAGLLQTADVAEGRDLEAVVVRMFADPSVRYVHAHNARPGCYNCRIDRA